MTDIRFAVLGPVRAWRGDVELDLGQPKQRAVLAALLMREGAQATLEGLVDDVWGEQGPATSTAGSAVTSTGPGRCWVGPDPVVSGR